MATVVQSSNRWGKMGQAAAEGATKGYETASDQKALQKAVESLGPDASGEDIVKAITKVNVYDSESKNKLIDQYVGLEKVKSERKKVEDKAQAKADAEKAKEDKTRAATKNIASKLDLPDEEKEVLGESGTLSMVEDLYKNQVKQKSEPNIVDKKIQEKNVEEYLDLEKDVPLLRDYPKNIQHVRELVDQLNSPLSGYVGTKLASEIEGAGLPLLQPIIKIFNPSGPLAQKKLEQLYAIYKIDPTDPSWKIQGKLKALEHYGMQALDRAEKRMELLQRTNFLPNKSAIEKFDKETETMVDTMLDYDFTGKEVPQPPGLPKAEERKGKTFRNKKDGQEYKSDGTKWVLV